MTVLDESFSTTFSYKLWYFDSFIQTVSVIKQFWMRALVL